MQTMPLDLRPPLLVTLGWLSALMVGCAAAGDSTPSASVPASASSRSFAAVPQPSASAGGVSGVPADLLSAVMEEAASGAGIDPSEVEVITADAVTWNDGSLGCPEPGMSYTQALVPGYRVILEIEGEELAFHRDASGEFRFCEEPAPGAAGDR